MHRGKLMRQRVSRENCQSRMLNSNRNFKKATKLRRHIQHSLYFTPRDEMRPSGGIYVFSPVLVYCFKKYLAELIFEIDFT
jgi:hypothetical protein